MKSGSEIDFIRRKYWWHLLMVFLTFSISILIFILDIICVTSEEETIYQIYEILEIIFCLLVFSLTCLELRYFYQVKQNNFSFAYSSIISQKFLKVLIIVLGIIYLAILTFTIIQAFGIINSSENFDCHFFNQQSKIIQLIISFFLILGQFFMMLIPYKILKTLDLLLNQKLDLVQGIFLNETNGDFQDIVPIDGSFCIIQTQKQKQIMYLPKSEINKFICKICTSKIKNNHTIVKISCQHFFHEQCFNKYALNVMKQQSFILTCKICDEGINIEKQEQYLIKELKSKISCKT